MGRCGLDSYGSRWESVAGTSKYGGELRVSIKGGKVLD